MGRDFSKLVILPNTPPAPPPPPSPALPLPQALPRSLPGSFFFQVLLSSSAPQLQGHLEYVISLSCGAFKSLNGSKSQCLIHRII